MNKTNELPSSEQWRKSQAINMASKTNFRARLAMSPAEKIRLKNAIANFPNKNGSPVGFNK